MKVGDLLMDRDGVLGLVLGHYCETYWDVKWNDMEYSISFDEKEIENGYARIVSKSRGSPSR